MRKEDCFFLGTVVAKYSFNGEVLIKLDTDEPQQYLSLASFLLEQNTGLVPYFTTAVKLHKTKLLRVSIEEVDSEHQANELIGKSVYLPLDQLPSLNDDQFYYHEIIGFEIVDSTLGPVGTIINVNDTNSQVLLEVDHMNKKILIPLVDEIIHKIDKEKKQIHLFIPNGLLNLDS
ncbi:MAG: ribosome maturation factor RimM [Bacteroidota bacterium]|nr:ribosome maturation factor RimM [Bacteroidota bacterium]